ARELDPLSLAVMTQAGNVLFYARRYDEAERSYRAALELDSEFQVARFKLMELYQSQHRFDDALAELHLIREGWTGISAASVPGLQEALGSAGPKGYLEAMRRFGDVEGWDAFFHAAILAALGRRDEAFAELERGVDDGDWYLIRVAVSPHMDPLRDDPRFPALLRKLKLDHVQPAPLPAEERCG
ncbi:MAG TPA: tetratricopeptide repeat protein, partial [Gemmatimonadota bacterium]|nr:tetratricopeptide repeat protein [Gemmatimonadota bacterium]